MVSFVLSMIAFGIHKKAYQAVAPPVHDPVSYYSKCKIVWQAIENSKWGNAFSHFPQRPPGIAPILYPFGFYPSIQSFLFRSTIAPIVIWALALILIQLPMVKDLQGALAASSLTAGLLSMPIFYHFEFPINPCRAYGISLQWGLVDVLQGSMSALAFAFLFTGIRKNLHSLIVLAWVTGAYTFFIKPSGILILGCLFIIFFAETIILWHQKIINKQKISKYILTFFVGFGIMVFSVWLAVASGYLSREVIQSAQVAAKILIAMKPQSLFVPLGYIVKPVFGFWWIFPVAAFALFSLANIIYLIYKKQFSELGLRLAFAVFIILAVLYWWMAMAGPEQRYLFPFIMLLMSWLIVPVFFQCMLQQNRFKRILTVTYCSIPAFAIITLLNIQQTEKTNNIKNFFGYNLEVGQYEDEVKLGNYLLAAAKKGQSQISIFSIGGFRVGVVEMINWVNAIESAEGTNFFKIYRVNNWANPGLKIKQMLSSDYFIVDQSVLEQEKINILESKKWQDEEKALIYFLKKSEKESSSGIMLIERGPVMLYKVLNRQEFAAFIKRWATSIQWSNDFWARNSYSRGDFDPPY